MNKEDLEILCHSASHIMAMAVMWKYPKARLAIGPAIENGFYYDIDIEAKISPEDFGAIEEKMREIVRMNLPFAREELSIAEAKKLFAGNKYKLEIIEDLAAKGESNVSIYRMGEFFDLCRGPHLESTGRLKPDAFKLLSVAGAYWRGDSKNKQLQRIYGTAFGSKKELDEYLHMLEEAEKRDHRKLGAAMDLFHFEPEYAPGAAFWHPKGWALFQDLIAYMRSRQDAEGYVEISTPTVMNRALWETSGHWDKFAQHMYYAKVRDDDGDFAVKPVNCPGGMLYFKQGTKSYRELPMKVAEFGKVERYETSGSLFGLMRVREFTQDDAHIFCTAEQLEEESIKVVRLIMDIYRDFGFEKVRIKLSTRPDVRLGSDEVWDASERALADALLHGGYEYTVFPGEGAIYGPKLEFVLTDAIGRDWQCGTLQVDMNLPERFDLSYIDSNGEKQRPVMLHRALFGSLERFAGILIENTAGRLPLWLAPVHACVIPISDTHQEYADKVCDALSNADIKTATRGLRIEKSYSSESMQKRIREAQVAQVPYMLILGDKEAAAGTVSIRTRDGQQRNGVPLGDFIAEIGEKIASKSLEL